MGRHSKTLDDPKGRIQVLYADGHVATGERTAEVLSTDDATTIPEFERANRLFFPLQGADFRSPYVGQ